MKHTCLIGIREINTYYCNFCKKEYEGRPENCPRCDIKRKDKEDKR